MESTDLHLGIFPDLSGTGFHLTGLDVQPVFKNVGGTEGPYPGLIALHSCQVVHTGIFQKLTYTFHHDSSDFFSFLFHYTANVIVDKGQNIGYHSKKE